MVLQIKSVKVTLDVVYVKCDSFILSCIIINQLYTYHVAGDQLDSFNHSDLLPLRSSRSQVSKTAAGSEHCACLREASDQQR